MTNSVHRQPQNLTSVAFKRLLTASDMKSWIKVLRKTICVNYHAMPVVDEATEHIIQDLNKLYQERNKTPFLILFFVMYYPRLSKYCLVASLAKRPLTVSQWTWLVYMDNKEEFYQALSEADTLQGIIDDIIYLTDCMSDAAVLQEYHPPANR